MSFEKRAFNRRHQEVLRRRRSNLSCLPTHGRRDARLHSTAVTFRRPTKVFEDGVQLMHLNYLLAFDGIIASRGGIPLIHQGAIDQGDISGAIGCSGGTDSQDEIISKAGAAVINQLLGGLNDTDPAVKGRMLLYPHARHFHEEKTQRDHAVCAFNRNWRGEEMRDCAAVAENPV